MVQRDRDPLTGASREDVLMCEEDARRLRLSQGAPVRLVSDSGAFRSRLFRAPIKPGNLEVHWPEAMPLLGTDIDRESGEPDYNALVRVEVV
jgi:anaerobic selenocysteine-containing dehydrogenase